MAEFTPEQEAEALARCAAEPAPRVGLVQGFVELIGIDAQTFRVCLETRGVAGRLGLAAGGGAGEGQAGEGQTLRGRTLEAVLDDPTLMHALRNAMGSPVARAHREQVGRFELGGAVYDLGVYVGGGLALLEFEPTAGPREQPGEAVARVRRMMTALGQAADLPTMLNDAVRMLRSFSGFNRVMAYRFLDDGCGEVVAEACAVGTEPFLGLRFPASDIPPQARALMRRSPLRMIPDVDAEHRVVDCDPGVTPDLSTLHGRGVSPVHAEYLKNMGVWGTMNLALVVNGELWGMFALHHEVARRVSGPDRTVIEMFGELTAVELEQRLEAERLSRLRRVRSSTQAFALSPEATPTALVARHWKDMLACLEADGVAVWAEGADGPDGPVAHGSTPPPAVIAALAALDRDGDDRPLVADALSDLPALRGLDPKPSAGVMRLDLGDARQTRLLFFRDEAVRAVRWAGTPHKNIVAGPQGSRLQPRRSFAAYVESVAGRCRSWAPADLDAAHELRSGVVQACFRASAADQRVWHLEKRSRDLLVAELNHRVKNILALVRSIVDQTRDSEVSRDEYAAALSRRIGALAKAHDQVGAGDGQWPRLHRLLRVELEPFAARAMAVEIAGPEVRLRPDVAPLLALVLHELVTNAAKYGALRPGGRLEVAWDRRDGGVALEWRERRGGDRPALGPPARRGFGVELIERAVAYECGGESRVFFEPGGVRAEVWIPGDRLRWGGEAAALGKDPAERGALSRGAGAVEAARDLRTNQAAAALLERVLVAEDRALLALEMERLLRELGAGWVDCVPSADAGDQLLDRLDTRRPTLAVLDVNLGATSSLPLAERLHAQGVPVVFVSGYASAPSLPDALRAAPWLTKPVGSDALRRVIVALAGGGGV